MGDISFEQFGAFAIVCILLSVAVGYLARQGSTKDKKIDDLQEKRLTDAKESRDQLIDPLKKMTDLTQQVYDAIIRNDNRG